MNLELKQLVQRDNFFVLAGQCKMMYISMCSDVFKVVRFPVAGFRFSFFIMLTKLKRNDLREGKKKNKYFYNVNCNKADFYMLPV